MVLPGPRRRCRSPKPAVCRQTPKQDVDSKSARSIIPGRTACQRDHEGRRRSGGERRARPRTNVRGYGDGLPRSTRVFVLRTSGLQTSTPVGTDIEMNLLMRVPRILSAGSLSTRGLTSWRASTTARRVPVGARRAHRGARGGSPRTGRALGDVVSVNGAVCETGRRRRCGLGVRASVARRVFGRRPPRALARPAHNTTVAGPSPSHRTDADTASARGANDRYARGIRAVARVPGRTGHS